jgi:hypothetical protein
MMIYPHFLVSVERKFAKFLESIFRNSSQSSERDAALKLPRSLEKETKKVRLYAECLLAHRTGAHNIVVTFDEVDHAVKIILYTMRRYYSHITASNLIAGTPVPQYSYLQPFSIPWLNETFHEPDDDETLVGQSGASMPWFKSLLNDPDWQCDPAGKARTEAHMIVDELLKQRRNGTM